MIRQLSTALLAAALAAAANPLGAQSETVTVTVTYEVREINEMDLSGDPGPLVVTHTSASGAPADAVDESTTWTVTTNQPGRKITGALDSDLPPGVTLRIALTAPEGGGSAGFVPLSTAPQDLVTAFGSVSASDLGVTYRLSASTEAGVVPRDSRIVTFTIAADI